MHACMRAATTHLLSHCWVGMQCALQVPVAIGGPGLPKDVKFRHDLKEPGLANVGYGDALLVLPWWPDFLHFVADS